MIVDVHMNGNDTMIVIRPVNDSRATAARADKAKHYTIARGSAMECAAHLGVMRIEELIDEEHYGRGLELLERVVAMLTKMIDP